MTIIPLDTNTPVLALALRRGCQIHAAGPAVLTVWRAGCATMRRDCTVEDGPCGPRRREVLIEVPRTTLRYETANTDQQGRALFLLDAALLAGEHGRYDGELVTPCGKVSVHFQLGGQDRLRSWAADATGPLCITEPGACHG
jgi:hypothetical protein